MDCELLANTLLYKGLIHPEKRDAVVEVLKEFLVPEQVLKVNGTSLVCVDCGVVECADLPVSVVGSFEDSDTLLEFRFKSELGSFVPVLARTFDGKIRSPMAYLQGKSMRDLGAYVSSFQCPHCQGKVRIQ